MFITNGSLLQIQPGVLIVGCLREFYAAIKDFLEKGCNSIAGVRGELSVCD